MGAASSQPPPEPQGAGLPRLDEAEGAGSARLRALSLARCSRLLQNFDPDMGSSASFNEILCLLDLEGCEYVDANELQHATQRLIDVLGCRHPSTLRRVSEVYVSVASGREGALSLTEFQGYVACVLTQILRELEARTAGLDAEARVTTASSGQHGPPSEPPSAGSAAPARELSDLERLMQELSSLNKSLEAETRREKQEAYDSYDHEVLKASAPALFPAAPKETWDRGGATDSKEPQGVEEIRLLAQELDVLNQSLEAVMAPKTALTKAPQASDDARTEAIFESTNANVHNVHAISARLGPTFTEASAWSFGFSPVTGTTAPCSTPGSCAGSLPRGEAVMDPGNTYAKALRPSPAATQAAHYGDHGTGPPAALAPSKPVPVAWGSQPSAEQGADADSALRPMADGWHMRVKGASKGIAHGWQALAETMDSIFVPGEAHGRDPTDSEAADPLGPAGPDPLPSGCESLPSIFRQPSVDEVRELMEQDGLPAHVAIAAAGCFCLRKLCLDTSSSPSLYVLDAESSVPALFMGMHGFSLDELLRIVVGTSPAEQPLLSLEFQEGFLPVKLGSPLVLQGLIGVLCQNRNVPVVLHAD